MVKMKICRTFGTMVSGLNNRIHATNIAKADAPAHSQTVDTKY